MDNLLQNLKERLANEDILVQEEQEYPEGIRLELTNQSAIWILKDAVRLHSRPYAVEASGILSARMESLNELLGYLKTLN